LEPVAWCSYQLRKLVVRGNRDQNKVRLLELIENVTGKSPSTPILGKSYKVLLAECEELNKLRGRRASDMTLPPNWDTCGPYAAYVVRGQVMLKHRHSPLCDFNPVSLTKLLDPKIRLKTVYVHDNYSDLRAVLKFPGAPTDGVLCRTLFPQLVHAGQDAPPLAVACGAADDADDLDADAETHDYEEEPENIPSKQEKSPPKFVPLLRMRVKSGFSDLFPAVAARAPPTSCAPVDDTDVCLAPPAEEPPPKDLFTTPSKMTAPFASPKMEKDKKNSLEYSSRRKRAATSEAAYRPHRVPKRTGFKL
jgi:hypothetical protein